MTPLAPDPRVIFAAVLGGFLLGFGAGIFGSASVCAQPATEPYTTSAMIERLADSHAPDGLAAFSLKVKGGNVTLMGDTDLELVKWLSANSGVRVPLALGGAVCAASAAFPPQAWRDEIIAAADAAVAQSGTGAICAPRQVAQSSDATRSRPIRDACGLADATSRTQAQP